MKFKLYALLTALLFLQVKAFAAISVVIVSPVANQQATDNVNISVAVASPYNLARVNAKVLTASTALYISGGLYKGSISLAGMPYDTLTLTVVAEDVLNNKDSASIKFFNKKFDSLPVFKAIRYPTFIKGIYMPFHAEAYDPEGSNVHLSLTSPDSSLTLAEGVNVIDTVADVSNLLERYYTNTTMRISGRDTSGKSSSKSLPFVYELSPYLETYYDKPVADFKYNKILQIKGSNARYEDLSNGDTALFPLDSGKVYLTPANYLYFKKLVNKIGTVYTKDTAYKFHFTYNYNAQAYNETVNGNQFVFGERSPSPGAYTVHVNTETKLIDTLGLTYEPVYEDNIKLYNVITEQNVDSMGNIVFSRVYEFERNFAKNIFYKIGDTATLYKTNAAPFNPVIKGNRILFYELNWYFDADDVLQYKGPGILKMIDAKKGNNAVIVDNFINPSFILNSNYIAYTKNNIDYTPDNDIPNYKTFYLVDTAGKKTGFTEDSAWNGNTLIACNEAGQMIVSSYGLGLTLLDKDGNKIPLTRLIYKATWYNGYWYLYSGDGTYGGVYKVNLSRGGLLSNITREVKKDSSYTFAKKDYDAAVGTGLAYDVKITALPKYGKLYFNNRLLVKDTLIRHASLDSIMYVPDSSFTGKDTANFNASNYLSFASSDALIIFSTVEVLPTQLSTFTGQSKGTTNQLSWQTAQEVNTAYFELQHATTANRNFTPLTQVTAAGNSNTAQSYAYTHTSPVAGTNYYRLKMVDKDGKFTYSRIVSINNGDSYFTAAVLPNPVRNNIILQLTSSTAQKVQLSIISLSGTVLLAKQFDVSAGITTKTIAAGSLAKGTYFIKVTGAGIAQANVKVAKE